MSTDVNSTRVKDVMSRDVVSIRAGETLHEALQLMSENRVAAIPVVDKRDHCVGMLSTSDLVDVTRDVDDDLVQMEDAGSMGRDWLMERITSRLGHEIVDSLMTENVAAVGLETSIVEATRLMIRNRIHRLPVVNHSEKLVGIVSTMDLLEAFADGNS